MDATSFELNVSLPCDTRYVETVRGLAVHAARYAGCREAQADQYGATVAAVIGPCLTASAGGLQVTVRRGRGPLEVLVVCEREVPTPRPAPGTRTAVEWTRPAGRPTCRIICDL